MFIFQVLPVVTYLLAIVVILMVASGKKASRTISRLFFIGLGGLFLVYSLMTVAQEGVLQFWVNHTTSFSGNQVWFDLLVAVTIGFYLITPRARAAGMALFPWAIAVVLTASIALLPMLARLLWLEQQEEHGRQTLR